MDGWLVVQLFAIMQPAFARSFLPLLRLRPGKGRLLIRLNACVRHAHVHSKPEGNATRACALHLTDTGATERLGGLLGCYARGGCSVLLHGEPGAGKTTFARGFIRAVCGDGSLEVPSPTFLLAHEYGVRYGGYRVYHVDLWRLSADAARTRPLLDFETVFRRDVCLIEWPDRLGDLIPSERLDVRLSYAADSVDSADSSEDDPWGFESANRAGRQVSLTASGEIWASALEDLQASDKFSGARLR